MTLNPSRFDVLFQPGGGSCPMKSLASGPQKQLGDWPFGQEGSTVTKPDFDPFNSLSWKRQPPRLASLARDPKARRIQIEFLDSQSAGLADSQACPVDQLHQDSVS